MCECKPVYTTVLSVGDKFQTMLVGRTTHPIENLSFWDAIDLGDAHHDTEEDAVRAAKEWAEAEGLEFRDS